jgi:hypothetical protein
VVESAFEQFQSLFQISRAERANERGKRTSGGVAVSGWQTAAECFLDDVGEPCACVGRGFERPPGWCGGRLSTAGAVHLACALDTTSTTGGIRFLCRRWVVRKAEI